ncbi:MAG: IclR family transcriptional regulator [Mycolicibacterium sp.]|uniref:IclR family transcriptional regulator n=1 Tax=Mycolicibacterium sp. TaxID=2320850 RepID=UPI003D142817
MIDGLSISPSSPAREHRTVSRVVAILERVARGPGVRLADLADLLDAPRSSVHGLVKGLVATGYLTLAAGGYSIGPAVGALLISTPPNINPVARPPMEALCSRFDETVMLASRVGESVVYTDAVESQQVIRYSPPLHTRRPLYPTSAGCCFLAFDPQEYREAFLHNSFSEDDRRDLVRRELEQVRVAGVAMNNGRTLPDVSGVGAPIFYQDKMIGALCVAGPTTRLTDSLTEIGAATKAAAQEITRTLDHRAQAPGL